MGWLNRKMIIYLTGLEHAIAIEKRILRNVRGTGGDFYLFIGSLILSTFRISWQIKSDHFRRRRRMPSFLYVTVDYFGFRRQECPFNIWPGLYLREALHGSGKTDNFLIPSTVGGWGSNFQTGHLLTREKWNYDVYKFTNLRIRKLLLLLLPQHRARLTTSSESQRLFVRNGLFSLPGSADRFPHEEVNSQRAS